jgi:signal transduction histidine kinase
LISHNLSSNYITDRDLEQLLLNLITSYENRKEFEIEMIVFPENSLCKLDQNVKLQLYRILQEMFTNISKHAKAKQVKINITNHPDALNIMIEDDGVGFQNTLDRGIGLKNIEERLDTINGHLIIESEVGKGSLFIIDVTK